MKAQGLSSPSGDGLAVVRRLVGLQAQDHWIAQYAVRTRARSGRLADVGIAWTMRGTLHLVAAEDLHWLVDLLGPRHAAGYAGRRARLGLTDALLRTGVRALVDRLPATRDELLAVAAEVGVPAGQARAHLLAYAGMTGELCQIDGEFRRIPAGRKVPDDLAGELGRRYLTGYGPASAEDFAAWSGLPLTVARKALPDQASTKDSAKDDASPVPGVKLLGHFDPYLLGYRDRTFALPAAYAGKVQRGGGFLQPVVLVDGMVAGTWTRTQGTGRRKGEMTVSVDAWADVPAAGLAAEVEDLNRDWWRS